MDRKGIDGVVDFEPAECHRCEHEEAAANGADGDGGPDRDCGAASRDRDQASQDAVAEALQLVPLASAAEEVQHERHDTPNGGGDGVVHGNLRSGHGVGDAVHLTSQPAAQAVPAEPQDQRAADDQRRAVRLEPLRGLPTPCSRSCDDGAGEAHDSAADVDHAATGEVKGTHIVDLNEPALAPDGAGHDRVDHSCEEDNDQQIPDEVQALGGAAADHRSSNARHRPMEEPPRHLVRGLDEAAAGLAIKAACRELPDAHELPLLHHAIRGDGVRPPECERPTHEKPCQCDDRRVRQVLHHNIVDALRSNAPGL
mmetsp:Transcript_60082/g.173251  ORF Transcript_60082/g.173251 Transcript_60082/m.173251 type:complete len:312 (-) Transcript_60082:419-1354(-)